MVLDVKPLAAGFSAAGLHSLENMTAAMTVQVLVNSYRVQWSSLDDTRSPNLAGQVIFTRACQ